jgi:hypothetical protein
MVEEGGGGVAGTEFESGVAGAADGVGVELVSGAVEAGVLSGVDEVGGGTGPLRVFVSGAAAEGAAGAVVEVAGPDAVRTTPWTWNFSRSARKRASSCAWETLK